MSGVNLLLDRFRSAAESPAIIDPDGDIIEYGALLDIIASCCRKLEEHHIEPGTAVQLLGDFNILSIAWMFTLWRKGCIVAPLAPTSAEMGEKFAQIGDVSWVLDAEADHLRPAAGNSSHELFSKIRDRGTSGLIIFSSGTTGAPKGAVHDVAQLIRKFEKPGKALRTMGFLLFDHISGIDTILYTLANCGTLVCLPGRDTKNVCKTIESQMVEVLPTAPSFLNMLLISGESDKFDLSSIKIITYGGEMMPQNLLERIAQTFPNASIIQKYGTSELGALRSKSTNNKSRWIEFDTADTEWRIRDDLLEIKTQTAMLGYLNAPSPFTADGWYQTGDRIEVQGTCLRFLGRDGDLISVGGQKVYPAEIENALQEIPFVEDAVVFGKPHPMLGSIICTRLRIKNANEDEVNIRARIRQALSSRLESYKIPQKIELKNENFSTNRFKKIRS